jgi:hypothetical protein
MYTLNQLKNYATLLTSGKDTFWASDFGFQGGDIGGLTRDFIDPTENTKTVFIPLGGNLYKTVEVQEWRVRKSNDSTHQELWQQKIARENLDKDVKLLCETADMFRKLGY